MQTNAENSENSKEFPVEISENTVSENEINLNNIKVELEKIIKIDQKACVKSVNSSGLLQTENEQGKKSFIKNKPQNSDSNLISKSGGFSKILTWDPWHKIGRNKTKKEKAKTYKNKEKMLISPQTSGDGFLKSILRDDSAESSIFQPSISETLDQETSEENFNPKPSKIRKIVRFDTDVKILHYMDDEILGHTVEPLKKELEQQERNKELRKEFTPEMGTGLKQQNLKKSASDYMAAWYKK